jgi:hypothetical protein
MAELQKALVPHFYCQTADGPLQTGRPCCVSGAAAVRADFLLLGEAGTARRLALMTVQPLS